MKRRTFLTAAGTVGIVGVASSATVVSSLYNNLSTSVLLEEFDTTSKKAFDKFLADIAENAKSLGIDATYSKSIAMPVQIISIDTKKSSQSIVYKNKVGQTVSLSENRVVIKSA